MLLLFKIQCILPYIKLYANISTGNWWPTRPLHHNLCKPFVCFGGQAFCTLDLHSIAGEELVVSTYIKQPVISRISSKIYFHGGRWWKGVPQWQHSYYCLQWRILRRLKSHKGPCGGGDTLKRELLVGTKDTKDLGDAFNCCRFNYT